MRFVSGMEVTCFVPSGAASGADTTGFAAVTFDGWGRAESASRQSGALAPAAATAAADRIIRRGLGLPGARPLACRMDGWPYGELRLDGTVPMVHGWRTPDYDALVLAYPAGPYPAQRHVVHVRVTRFGFVACQPRAGAAARGAAESARR